MERALVVSIHDVAPATQERVAAIVREIKELGVAVTSLLVVPDYHHRGSSMADAQFCDWLRDEQAQGSEIVLHGFYHQRPRQPGDSARERLVTRFYTADEGEFFDLPYEEALRRISQARDDFAARGFRARGFIAPAWLLGREAERAAIDAGMAYTTTLRTVRDFVARQVIASQSLVYSVRSEWRRGISLGWNRWLFARLAQTPLLRLSLHPPDISHPAIWRQVRELILRAREERVAWTYQDWLTRQAFLA